MYLLMQKLGSRSRSGRSRQATGAEAETAQFLPCGAWADGGGSSWKVALRDERAPRAGWRFLQAGPSKNCAAEPEREEPVGDGGGGGDCTIFALRGSPSPGGLGWLQHCNIVSRRHGRPSNSAGTEAELGGARQGDGDGAGGPAEFEGRPAAAERAGGLDGMSRKRPAEEVVDFDLDGPGAAAASSPSSGDNDGGHRRRRVGAAGADWGLAEVLAECGLDPRPGGRGRR
ncbi:hypothetical protein THAOC_06031, partial [Thalassiosira oceanica]